jgi:hypothetical protein
MLMRTSSLFFFAFSLLMGFAACKPESPTVIANGTEYFPLAIGKYRVYRVDSIVYYTLPARRDTSVTYVREVLTDTLRDDENALIYKLERYERRKLSDPYDIKKVFKTSTTAQAAFRTENNLRYLKLPFPFIEKTAWDGNVYISPSVVLSVGGDVIEPFSKRWYAEITAVGKADTVNNVVYNDVAKVLSQNKKNILEKRYLLEKYAKNIGLIYREEQVLDTQVTNDAIPFEQRAQKGYILKQMLLEYN